MIEYYFGALFALLLLLALWVQSILFKRQMDGMEHRMTHNMIRALEKFEWGETNGRTQKKDDGSD